jgi:probable rRNA maturation factor
MTRPSGRKRVGVPAAKGAPAGGHAGEVVIANRQRAVRVGAAELRRVIAAVLDDLGVTAEVGVHLVGDREMACVNWEFLRHEGPTDVITFDHGSGASRLHGELFVCGPVAVRQAVEFQATPRAELLRYVIHGLLHLAGHDDVEPVRRRVMKREENRLVRRCVAP